MPGNIGICSESGCPLNNKKGGCMAPQTYNGYTIELAAIADKCLLPEPKANLEHYLMADLVDLIEERTGQPVNSRVSYEDLYRFAADQFGEELLTLVSKTPDEDIYHIFA
jgi:hypothetical protein